MEHAIAEIDRTVRGTPVDNCIAQNILFFVFWTPRSYQLCWVYVLIFSGGNFSATLAKSTAELRWILLPPLAEHFPSTGHS